MKKSKINAVFGVLCIIGFLLVVVFISYFTFISNRVRVERYYDSNCFYLEGYISDTYSYISSDNYIVIKIEIDTLEIYRQNIESINDINRVFEDILFSGLYDNKSEVVYISIKYNDEMKANLLGADVIIDTNDISLIHIIKNEIVDSSNITIDGLRFSPTDKMDKIKKRNPNFVEF